MPKYSFDTNIGVLLDTPETRALIDEHCPELLEHPMLELARTVTVNVALPFMEGLVDESRVDEFRKLLEAIE